MSQIIDLGKLRFSFAGDYNPATTYEFNDIVKYGGNVYVYTYALKASGHLPTDTTYWALMVEGIKFKGIYDNAYSYKVGDAIAYGGKVYIAVIDVTGRTPPNVTYWSQFADGIQYEGTFVNTNQYQKNDIVQYGSSAYIALQDTTGNLPTVTAYWAKLVEGVSASGAWNSTTNYVPNDLVAYGANQYKAIANNNNQLPINATGTLNASFWALMTEGVRSRGEWASATEYYINDIVTHGGNAYVALKRNASTENFDTDLAAAKWTKFNGGIRWRGTWAANTIYLKDDVVKDAVGSAYLALSDHTSGTIFNTDLTATKWQIFVKGGSDVLPVIDPSDIGQSLTVTPNGIAIDWIGATQSDNVYYVAPHGTDTLGQGKNLSTPFASVKYACQQATLTGQKSTIFVRTGTYQEQLPIVVPANTAIVGDNQRTVIINAKAGTSDDGSTLNSQSIMFQMSNGSILNKMTFTGMTGWVPGSNPADISTSTPKGVVVGFNPASPITTKSPYVLECSFIGQGAIGALVDGAIHSSGAKTMIFHGYTVISDNGVGYWIKDGGKSEIVSCFTYYAYFGYASTGGGHIRALNGNNSYGTYGLYSQGYNPTETPLTGTLVGRVIPFTYTGNNISVGSTLTGDTSGATAVVLNVQYSANKIYVKNITGAFQTNENLTVAGSVVGFAKSALQDQSGFILVAKGFSSLPKAGNSISLAGDTYSYVIQSTTGAWTNTDSEIVLVLSQEKPSGSPAGTAATVRSQYSQIRVTGHDFLSIGTGGVTTTNYPNTPTQPAAQGNETIEAFPGRVFYVSTDQDGNYRVGKYFKIDQATGKATLNASAFDLSGLSSLRLGSIGAQLGEQINEFSSDATLSDASNLAVPTEYAVKTYADTKVAKSGGTMTGLLTLSGAPSIDLHAATKKYVDDLVGAIQLFPANPTETAFLQSNAAGVKTWFPLATITSGNYPRFSNTTTLTTANTSGTQVTYFQATNGTGAAVTHSLVSGTIPGSGTFNANGTYTIGTGITASGSATFTIRAVSNSITVDQIFTWNYDITIPPVGQTLYGTNFGSGTFSWTAPAKVNAVSVVAVGGGGGGAWIWANPAGGGGGLGWKNNIPVTAGTAYSVVVGAGGGRSSFSASNGGNSYFISTSTVAGYGGGGSNQGNTGGPNQRSFAGGGWTGDYGGAGGFANNYQGGGGAGGYTGNGGDAPGGGRFGNFAPAGGGGQAGDYYSSFAGTSAGGGVGLLGQGASGYYNYTPYSGDGSYGGGRGGSGGDMGGYGENPFSGMGQGSYNSGANGGNYGGGGGGPGTMSFSYNSTGGNGGQGGVRIIWGTGRSYPATGTADQ